MGIRWHVEEGEVDGNPYLVRIRRKYVWGAGGGWRGLGEPSRVVVIAVADNAVVADILLTPSLIPASSRGHDDDCSDG